MVCVEPKVWNGSLKLSARRTHFLTEGNVIKSIDSEFTANAVVGRDHVYFIQEKNLEAFSLSNPAKSETIHLSTVTSEKFVRIDSVHIAGVKQALCLTDRTGMSKIIDVSNLHSPSEIASYFHTPWFVNSSRSGGLFTKLSNDLRSISIYELEQVIEI